MRLLYPAAAFCAVTALVVAGACKKKEEKAPTAESVGTTADVKAPETPPVLSAAAAKLAPGTKVAVIELEKGGTIEIELLEKEAPKTTANFVKLVEEKFYDGIPFHRVEPNFVSNPTSSSKPATPRWSAGRTRTSRWKWRKTNAGASAAPSPWPGRWPPARANMAPPAPPSSSS